MQDLGVTSPDDVYGLPATPIEEPTEPTFELPPEPTVAQPSEEKVGGFFDPRARQDFEGMLYLGRLAKRFTWSGHKIHIQTIDQDTYLELGPIVQRYENTWGALRAQVAATVAAALVSIDGKGWPVPLSEDESLLDVKFAWVRKLHPFAIDAIYNEFLVLEAKVADVLEEMGKASGAPLPPTSNPGSDLPTAEGSSPDPG